MPFTRLLLLASPILLAAAPSVPAATSPTAVAPTAQAILDAAKAASGGAAWDRLITTHDHGKITIGGLSGTFDDWLDWPHVKQSQSYALGPATGAQGWDGQTSWSVDASGQVRKESSAEAVAAAVAAAYFATSAAFFPARYPAQFDYAGTRESGGVTYQVVRITPKLSDPVNVWFDPVSHLPERTQELTGAQPRTTVFSEFRDVDGVKMPFHSVSRVGNDPQFDQVIEVVASSIEAVPDSKFAPPPPPAYDAQFPSGQTSVTVPFRLLNNHIYLLASINKMPTVPFVFDTGATNFLDADHARMLGIKSAGAMPGGGFGSKIASVGLAKVGSVSIGGMTLTNQVFVTEASGEWIKVEGADSYGLLGYEFAKRAVMTIDYAKHRITFTKPDAFVAPSGVTPVPFTFDGHIPMVKATVDGLAGEFEIDTGARSALTLMGPFAQTNGLVAKYHATHVATTGFGVGGPSKALLARVDVLAIGPVSIKRPVVDLVTDTGGAAAEQHTSGNIGGDTLKRFTVTLDYGHQLLYLQPNALLDQPDVFDRSGLWVNRGDDMMIAIGDVSADSAASKAGLKVGDSIRAVDGRDSRAIEIYELRDMLKGKPGTVVHLLVKGVDGKTRKIAIKLQDQV